MHTQANSRLAREIINALSPNGPDDLLMESLRIRWLWLQYPAASDWGFVPWLKDRAVFAYAVCLKPLRWLLAGRRSMETRFIACDLGAKSERTREYRRFFLGRAFGHDPSFVGFDDAYPSCERPRLSAAIRLWGRGVAWSLRSWFDFGPTRYSWLGFALAQVMDFEVLRDSCDRLYVFGVHNPVRYLAAAYAHQVLGMDVALVAGNTPLYRYLRATHLDCRLVLCSRIQEHELAYFADEDINNASGVYAGNEFALDFEGLAEREPSFDLAYYSSGMWAREGGLIQTTDIEAIRAGAFLDNPYTVKTQEILATMAQLARAHGWRFKIYPHPYERRLLRDHGIEPPYLHLVDGQTVFFDDEGVNSRTRMAEARVAVSLQSTLIFERLDAGYECSYVYWWDDPSKDSFLPKAAGPYADRCFGDMEGLKTLLMRDLAAPEEEERT